MRRLFVSATTTTIVSLSLLTTTIAWAQSPSKPSGASEPVAKIESCPVDPTKVAKLASKRGYQFLTAATSGEATCSIDEANLILVVSATSLADAICSFELFNPPQNRRLGIIRIGIKAGPGTAIRYVQRETAANRGLKLALTAQRNETRQFRLVEIDVEPIANTCPDAVVNGAIP